MKKIIVIFFILVNTHLSFAQLIPVSNSLQAVFKILNTKNKELGSSVLVADDNGKIIYLVTCKHLFNDCNYTDKQDIAVQVYRKESWIDISCRIHFHPNKDVDLVALELINETVVENRFEITMKGIYPGLEVYFLGYPLGLEMKVSEKINNGFNLPWVKFAHVSSFYIDNGVNKIFLDGMNNKGFSGSPVFGNLNNKLTLIGIVSGYFLDGVAVNGNSGIMSCISVTHLNELINP